MAYRDTIDGILLNMSLALVLLIAFLGSVIPALLWLLFWLMEDRCQPEPMRYILFSFLAGAAMVFVALQLERYAQGYFTGLWLYVVWACIEEVLKFGGAYIAALRFSVFDEPLDGVIYLVTAALGFSATENALFLIPSLLQGDALRAIATGDMRFIGATLLHTLSSATIGIMLALTFNKPAFIRRWAAVGGVVLAVLLHTLFNFFILNGSGSGTFLVFLFIWIGIVALLLFVERIKIPQKDYC